jgi:hypothetical protein
MVCLRELISGWDQGKSDFGEGQGGDAIVWTPLKPCHPEPFGIAQDWLREGSSSVQMNRIAFPEDSSLLSS